MTTRAFDLEGNEVFLRIANGICPAEHIQDAREIASEYWHNVENVDDWQPEKMLPTPLSPTGQAPATHYVCSMKLYSNQVAAFVQFIADAGLPWIATEEQNLESLPADKFYVCCGIRAEFLAAAGLQVVEA